MFVVAANSMAAGPDFWHFNNNLLTDIDFINTCRNTIRDTVIEFAQEEKIAE